MRFDLYNIVLNIARLKAFHSYLTYFGKYKWLTIKESLVRHVLPQKTCKILSTLYLKIEFYQQLINNLRKLHVTDHVTEGQIFNDVPFLQVNKPLTHYDVSRHTHDSFIPFIELFNAAVIDS